MHLHSAAAYADKILDEISEADYSLLVAELKGTSSSDLVKYHHTWGTAIRNEFSLWATDHPLTKNWHQNPDDRNIVDGVDFSDDHPDSVSMRIMELVHKKINA